VAAGSKDQALVACQGRWDASGLAQDPGIQQHSLGLCALTGRVEVLEVCSTQRYRHLVEFSAELVLLVSQRYFKIHLPLYTPKHHLRPAPASLVTQIAATGTAAFNSSV